MSTDETTIKRLRDALKRSRQLILEQSDQMIQLTAVPSLFGIVASMNHIGGGFFRYGDQVVGTKEHEGQIGVVIEELNRDGKVGVRFDEGDALWCLAWDTQTGRPHREAEVLALNPRRNTCRVIVDGKLVDMAMPRMLSLSPGNVVTINPQTMQIIDVVKNFGLHGEVAIFRRMLDNTRLAEVTLRGETQVVYPGSYDEFSLKEGDRVLLDPSGMVISKNLGQEQNLFGVEEVHVSWDEIGGLQSAKEMLQEAIELPITHAHLFHAYNKRPLKGAVLWGPPGNGKTLLGKAAATAVAKFNGHSNVAPFMYIKGPALLSHFVGDSEAAIRAVFTRARKYRQEHDSPILIFWDEADALLKARGRGLSSDINDTNVAQFLSEMDGLDDQPAFVLLATNRPDMIDPAVMRDGRMDRMVHVPRPDVDAAKSIFEIHLQAVQLHNGYSVPELAERATAELFDPKHKVAVYGNTPLSLGQIASGAMIAGVVDRGSTFAMKRDIKDGGRRAGGLALEDLYAGIRMLAAEQTNKDHTWEYQELVNNNSRMVLNG